MQHFRHFFFVLFGIWAVAACGGSPSVTSDGDTGNPTGGRPGTGGTGGEGVGFAGNTGSVCEPETCETLSKNCGSVPDGCGGILECGECEDAALCGLVVSNACATEDDLEELCQPIDSAEACADKQCGVEGDGCGGTHDCGSCPTGQACGVEAPFQCSPAASGSDDDCPAVIPSCAAAGAECGIIGNGCGGSLDCEAETGGCEDGEACGLGGPELCGPIPSCEPLEPAEACAGKCGIVSNGCGADVAGGIIDCSALLPCPNGETCGGAGVANECGSGQSACPRLTQQAACAGRECGVVGDGCDGSYSCGTCGGSALCVAGSCEVPACTAVTRTVACAGRTCGTVGDGCGGTHSCGTCPTGQQCGLRTAFQCAAVPPSTCVPLTQQQACAGKQCGIVYNGCGTAPANQINCGTCPSGQFCGLQQAFQCAAPVPPQCTPNGTSCAALGWACGMAVNSCGTVYDCAAEGRTCGGAQTCVGGLTGPTTCQNPGGSTCPLCAAVPTCTGTAITRLTGRVVTPGRTNTDTANQIGVPNAAVYILRTNNPSDLPAITAGIPSGANGESCDRCEDQDLGPVLASTQTNATGNYVLEGNIPVGEEFLLVVKVGKFRRAQHYTLAANRACINTNLPTAVATNPTRLPRSMTDGLRVNIPRIAVTTGPIDAMECVFSKMGVATAEFGNGSATTTGARVHLYRGAANTGSPPGSGARIDNNTPHDTTLYGDEARMRSYDMIVADCEGGSWDSNFSQRSTNGERVRQYVNRGGRMFASHLSFSWLHDNGSAAYASGAARFSTGLAPAATWQTSAVSNRDDGTGIVSRGRPNASPRIENFAAWMAGHNIATPPNYTFSITDPRSQVTALGTFAEEFVHCEGGDCTGQGERTQQFSFNTPYAAQAQACGRVAYSGFHVAATGGGSTPFASSIFPAHCAGDLTAQEKVLLYMLFDLGACVGDDPDRPGCTPRACPASQCGTLPNGCGGTLNCGCPSGQTCSDGSCVPVGCVPTTCAAQGVICSTISNGCGQALQCECPVCTPIPRQQACAQVTCGNASDGCSNVYLCSDCPPDCQPLTACPEGLDCGIISDGCSGTLNCGSCPPPQVCGAGGQANQCDIPMCTPLTCSDLGATCGMIGDGCGGSENCGPCPAGQVCRTTNGEQSCQGCVPRTCAQAGAECGLIGDGCGGTVQCGPCPTGQICGATAPNQCGDGPGCTPLTCSAARAECGVIGDGCGGQVNCGPCPAGEVCGLTTPFRCAPPPPCTPVTCEAEGAECGMISDGCSGLLDCGNCPPGSTCGLVEANQCAGVR